MIQKMMNILKSHFLKKSSTEEKSLVKEKDNYENITDFLKREVEKNNKDFMFLIESITDKDKNFINYNFACTPENNKKLAMYLFALLNGFLTESILENLDETLIDEYSIIESEFGNKKPKKQKKSKLSYISPLDVLKSKKNELN